jgi:hypothetical protein
LPRGKAGPGPRSNRTNVTSASDLERTNGMDHVLGEDELSRLCVQCGKERRVHYNSASGTGLCPPIGRDPATVFEAAVPPETDALSERQHLLVCLSEECGEIADECLSIAADCHTVQKRVAKALRFGEEEVQPGQDATNTERLMQELADLAGVLEMLEHAGVIDRPRVERKKLKVTAFMDYARGLGALKPEA